MGELITNTSHAIFSHCHHQARSDNRLNLVLVPSVKFVTLLEPVGISQAGPANRANLLCRANLLFASHASAG